jgi:hypothetical protein
MLFQFLLTGSLLFGALWIIWKFIVLPLLHQEKTPNEREAELRLRIKELEIKKKELIVSKQLLDVKTIEKELDEKQKELDNLLEDV